MGELEPLELLRPGVFCAGEDGSRRVAPRARKSSAVARGSDKDLPVQDSSFRSRWRIVFGWQNICLAVAVAEPPLLRQAARVCKNRWTARVEDPGRPRARSARCAAWCLGR